MVGFEGQCDPIQRLLGGRVEVQVKVKTYFLSLSVMRMLPKYEGSRNLAPRDDGEARESKMNSSGGERVGP